MKHSVFCFLLLILAVGCRTKGPRFDAYEDGANRGFAPVDLTNRLDNSLLQPPTEPYRLGPGDVVQIESIGESTGSATVMLGPDGKIYYSLLPGISLWGLSIPECRTALQREIAKYNRATPDLVINLRGVASQRVWFLGAVQSPGIYPLTGPTTLLQAIATLGGLAAGNGADDAVDYSRSFVLRNGSFLPVDFERLIKHADATQNIYLQPDDFVFVRPVDLPSVYVLGAVDGASTVPYSKDLTVARLIVTLGGPVKFAQVSRIVILRGSLTSPK
ncbi:MAG TPA: SLBB domain-containing protein, partial [Methylomirabilota bacterium]|nr:SLBB domain-containing protein [Methylomirabilota bacterium]